MALYSPEQEEQLRLLHEWKSNTQKDIDGYQELVDEHLRKKRRIEELASKKLRPILKKVAVFQRFVDNFTNRRNEIDRQIKKVLDETKSENKLL